MQWVEEESHSIICGKDLDRNESVVREGDVVNVRVRQSNKTEWYGAKIIASGTYIHVYGCMHMGTLRLLNLIYIR